MNKFVKILIAVLLSAAVLAGGTLGVLYYGFGIDVFDQSGWAVSEEGATQYLDYHGTPLYNWQLIDGSWYYFDPVSGAMTTGWVELEGTRYHLSDDGTRSSGWLTLDDGTYYLSPTSGAASTAWLTLEGERYFMDSTGKMLTGWNEVDSDRYYFAEDGTVATGWLELEGSQYYLGDDGIMQTGWLETEEGTRYLDETTGAMVTGWAETDSYRRYFDENGYLCNGWTETPEGTYYLNELGCAATGWLETEEGTYYLSTDGAMTVGWLEMEGSCYYFREDGTMAIGKEIIDGTASYFASNGAYVVMVNRWNAVPEDYTTDLVYYGEWQVDSSCYDALKQMLSDCPYSYEITSAYRSVATQQYIWDKRIGNYLAMGYSRAEAEERVGIAVAIPGTSEHHLGLAVDISAGTDGHTWLAEHSWEYGFIVRYPEGSTDITGIMYEPWHFRYLGPELAKEVYDTGLCLEEYFDMLTQQQGSDTGTASDPEKYTSCYSASEE